ncbi:DUF1365 domain-containing protein [Chitinibacter bivalviorum]|uniref:DUF1365 domain-containing protein n=1 Tax=Chitinibacter bivalviorum TaxID=2739434 RepID=A0A7H9BFL3_9NEIS|nr:DUF1365 domain-containing protein [Chitinibacter bivalviorum]QLG87500.1 DUF1365 domain-containing protein [Chitinibacter bivalviorum]
MNATGYVIRGQVMHARLRPAANRFVYPVFCIRINLARLAELDNAWFGVDRTRIVSIRTRDYGPRDGSNLQRWMRQLLAAQHITCDGEIWLQTFPRVLGFAFNPVSFWYCHDAGGNLIAVLAEVNNTFGETHRYLLQGQSGAAIDGNTQLIIKKLMHVSPFCEVQGHYQFRFRDTEQTSFVGIDYYDESGLLIKTAIGGYRQAWSLAAVRYAVMMQPFLTFGVVCRIHWQAAKLWWKKVPFFRKPAPPEQGLSFQQERTL